MDDLAEKIAKLLEDPEGMEKIKQIASVLASQTEASPASAPVSDTEPKAKAASAGLDMSMISKVMPIIDNYQKSGEDPRVKLLYALKPYLKSDRASRIEETVNVLKITKAAQSAGFNLNFFNKK